MPDCINCKWFSHEKRDCTVGVTVRADDCFLRNCVWAILHKHCSQMSGNVLEVGYGMRKHARKLMPADAKWHGVEPKFASRPERNEYKGSAAHMPFFADGFFDWCISTESMEHWHEKGDTVEAGLAEIARVLRPGGTMVATVPLHLHGGKAFQDGDLKAIKHFFDPALWAWVEMEEWRKNYAPCPPPLNLRLVWPHLRRSDRSVLSKQKTHSWTLEIIARRR